MTFSPTATARLFTTIAFVEAASWVGLLAGMFLKHVTRTTEVGVQIFGMAHGIIVLVYVAIAVLAYVRLKWTFTELTIALIAAVPPLATIPAERWLRGRGRLEDPATRTEPAENPDASHTTSGEVSANAPRA